MSLRRLGAAGLVLVVTLLAGCASRQPADPAGCQADGTASAKAPRTPDALGDVKAVPGQGGLVDAEVTAVVDPLTGGHPDPGCRLVGLGFRLLARTSAVSVDLFKLMRLVTANGDSYQPYTQQVEGRDGIDDTSLMPGDERRGTENFEVPAGRKLSYFAVNTDDLVTDVSKPATLKVPAFRPGDWPKLSTTQVVDRLSGEQLTVRPLKVLDPTPATDGVAAGRRAYSVRLSLRNTGTKTWPLNPENMMVFIDSQGHQWQPGFVTTTAAPPFDPLHVEPGGKPQTAWVTAEIPGDARIVATELSPYPGIVRAWRI